MARLTSAIACDFAQIREDLLFVSSGGITRLYRESMPSPLGLSVALSVEVPHHEREQVHEVKVVVCEVETAGSVATAIGALSVSDRTKALLEPGESALIPMVLPLQPVGLERWGQYDIRCSVDGGPGITLTVYAKRIPPPSLF